jgi:hypothetical protein
MNPCPCLADSVSPILLRCRASIFCRWQEVGSAGIDAKEHLWGSRRMNDDGIRQQLESLKVEHRDLDDSISALQEHPITDQLQIARLKRRKLALKDRIRVLEDQLVPDIIA